MKDKIVYISNNHKNIKVLRSIVSRLARDNLKVCFVCPKLMFSHLENEEYMKNSITLLDMCDEMWAVGGEGSAQGYELAYCREYKIPVRTVGR